MHFTGPVGINLQGTGNWGVASMPGQITFDDTLTVTATGANNSGLYLLSIPIDDTLAAIQLNGAGNVQASGDNSFAMAILGGNVYVNNTLNVSANNGASAIEMMANNPEFGSLLTTNSPSNPQATPNPQKILLQGKIHLSNGFNQMLLDLAEGSIINSQLDIVQGNFSWKFR